MRLLLDRKGEITIRALFFVAVFLTGIFVTVAVVRDFSHARESNNWPTVTGIVVEKNGPKISYAYSWDADFHRADRHRFTTSKFFWQQWEVDMLPNAGEELLVYVSPEDTAVSVIEPGGSRYVFVLYLFVGSLLTFFGGGGLALFFSPQLIAKQSVEFSDEDRDQPDK